MVEDVQPNERLFSRKGAAIPTVHSAHRKTGNRYSHFSRAIATTSNYRQPGTRHTNQYEHRRHNYPNDGWQAKRRRIEYDSCALTSSGSGHTGRPNPTTSDPHPKVRKPKKREPTELLVDIPPECMKGAPGCQKLRKQWIALQIKEIQANIGVNVQFCGYLENSARFTCTDDQASVAKATGSGSHLPADVDCHPYNEMQDAIIISDYVIDVDADVEVLDEHPSVFTVGEQQTISIDQQSVDVCRSASTVRPADSMTMSQPSAPESIEPLRVFSSGVLSFSTPTRATKSPSPEFLARTAPVVDLTAIGYEPSAGQKNNDLDSGTTSTSETRTQRLASPSLHVSSVGQISTSKPDMIHAVNYECQQTDTVSHAAEVRFSLHDLDGIPIQVPTQQHEKSRRVLSFDTLTSSILNVSTRGSFNLVDLVPFRHRGTLKAPELGGLVDDACLLRAGNDYLAVLGHARDQEQLSCFRIQVKANQLSDAFPIARPWTATKKGGVSAVASMLRPLQFATGGYDHVVHLWDVKADFSDASSRPLPIKHTSQIQSLLAIRDTSHKLLSAAADCNVHFWDLSSERVVNTVKTSNMPYHAHTTLSPFCTLLEVAHRELQFEVRDHRLVPERPVQRFGYTADKAHGRFIKGDIMSYLFACGGNDGLVRLWDLRNLKVTPQTIECGQGQKIVQVLFTQSRLVVCSQAGQMRLFRINL